MAKLILCVSIILMLLAVLSETSAFCCTPLQYREDPVQVRFLKYYVIQEDTGVCNFRAVIFRTVRHKLLCANPDSQWVQDAMESVPQKKRAA